MKNEKNKKKEELRHESCCEKCNGGVVCQNYNCSCFGHPCGIIYGTGPIYAKTSQD